MNEQNKAPVRPALYNDLVEDYLHDLRESAVTNMFGASPYLVQCFGMTEDEARACLSFWMRTFKRR
jgi:hypothetical protein